MNTGSVDARSPQFLETLERTLAAQVAPAKVASVTCRPSAYETSFALQEIDVTLDDGRGLALILKDLDRASLSESARRAKPEFLYDPRREIVVYSEILPAAPPGPARCYAAMADDERGQYWLLLERVPGIELYQVGALAAWEDVARWLAGCHEFLRRTSCPPKVAKHLVMRDEAYHRRWLERARSFTHADDHRRMNVLARLASRFDALLSAVAASPRGLLHGEFYASNVLIDAEGLVSRVCPVDWEMAGIGPVLLDLAALTCGWDDAGRSAMALAYYDAAGRGRLMPLDRFLHALTCCEILVAIQWMGWADAWLPPPEHRRDWVGTMNRLLEDPRPTAAGSKS